jgi:TonB family protein
VWIRGSSGLHLETIHEFTRTNTKHVCHLPRQIHGSDGKELINSDSRVSTRVLAQLSLATLCLLLLAPPALAQPRSTRLAVLDFGKDPTGLRAAAAVRETLNTKEEVREFTVTERDQSSAAALGAGFDGSLNLTIQQARDMGAAIGCDFYIIGEAQTLRRVPSDKPAYYESFATLFLVSARTGRLVLWERPTVQRDSSEESEKALLAILSSAETRERYFIAVRGAQENERAERVNAVESAAQIIEVMSDDAGETNQEVRAPRPYRRLKPPYPEAAARAEVEATVEVLVDIDARGEVGRVEISRWAGYGLDQSVIDTVKQMHFFPAMRNGSALPMRVLLRYNFRKPPK